MSVFKDSHGDLKIGYVIALVIVAVVASIFVITASIRQIDHYYTAKYCQPRLEQFNRQGKFVDFNYWSYDCLVKTAKGTYVPLDALYNNTQEN